jgi:membrane protein DedA with SNARE-associated domain
MVDLFYFPCLPSDTIIMDLPSLIETYGYFAILIGTFLEGETVLVLGGFAAQQGYLVLTWVILAAFAGSLFGDQLFFYLGRQHSRFVLSKRPAWEKKVDKAYRMLDRFQTPMILSFRFLYGLRTITPFVIGMSRVPVKKFVLLNATGALIWAIVVGSCGYLFGHALEIFIGKIKHYEMRVFAMIALVGLLIWCVHFYHQRKHKA